ncbi:MotA/TolQ/ExbB proton channel family protein [Pseudobacteriovorax antillogorgiicola]|uniref:MotA/TolQ/ExbB proton channel family protein n=1 Tax=Pseudobacteriovorax antillogorgiicola TaxID=1513793 RepID=A0A1Y6CM94_9BACT|nr:MotA/TolQ/ExbB proton channel family protein [Pseudobacteriovorax antillogorgiicola]TCS44802.1 MotA/TolQ/ExbB proton channel family protein [Pseudobacteriovorax antillogorgiicola]SMF77345.1 MotA/TolQ/ExbB proton channel family protein [Pseudobacteriovorax antillogorgiicola]
MFKFNGSAEKTAVSAVVKAPKLGVNQKGAGAGVVGLLGFVGLLLLSIVFFVTENYFVSMAIISVGLMVYVAGTDVVKIFLSSFTVFFSSRHVIEKAACLVETNDALNKALSIKKNKQGHIKIGPVAEGEVIRLPDNPFTRDIQRLAKDGKDYEYAEFVAHSYYTECHELYDYSHANLEFVADAMPLFGLIGTIIGLIAMFDGLGANVSIESLTPQLALALKTTLYGAVFSSVYKIVGSRFDQRLKALDYDYETVCQAIKVIIENKNEVEVEI